MKEYIEKDLPIDEWELSYNEALDYFKSIKHYYLVTLIEGNNSDSSKFSCLDDFLTLLFRPLAKSTGIIKYFNVRLSSDKNSFYYYFQQIQNLYLINNKK